MQRSSTTIIALCFALGCTVRHEPPSSGPDQPPPAGPTADRPVPAEPVAPSDAAPPAAVVAPPPPDAAQATIADSPPPAAGCNADPSQCCMPDGRIVVPGGCQPSYPSNVQPATQRGADGMCEKIPCYLKCLPAAAMIATPAGEARVDSLRTGDVVWTVDESGRRVQAPIARIESVPVGADATVVEIALADGRITRASAGHPIASGTTVGQLSIGDTLDGALVSSRREIPYAGDHTWDLLPVGSTGLYWADGVLLGSTLMPKRGR